MMKRAFAASGVALLSLTLLAQDASAFEFSSECQPGRGAVWSPSRMPVQYHLNSAGTADMPFAQMQQIVADSFAAWSTPCESSFSSQYVGTTTDTAYTTQKEVVFSWAETQNQWPAQLGDPYDGTIAVTLASIGGCTIYSAPIIFNGIAHTYTDQCGANFCTNNGTDLQSIATHEIGHLLGLTHSSYQNATMYYAYLGGNIARSLSSDDVAGVNALYPDVCSCVQDSDCLGADEQCINGSCEDVPCVSNNDCETGLACDTASGDCVIPPCTSDASCGPGFTCQQGTCRSECPVCRDCQASNVCGANAVCSDLDQDGAGECIVFCDQRGGCPGDGVCYTLQSQGQDYYICLNPDANQVGTCPDTYVCEQGPPPDPCEGVTCSFIEYCDNGACVPYERPDMGMRPADMNPPVDMNPPMMDMNMPPMPDMGTPPVVDMSQPPTSDMGAPVVDMGAAANNQSPNNQSPNNQSPNNQSPNHGNTTSMNTPEDDFLIIIPPPEENPEVVEETCSSAPARAPSAPGGLLLGLVALLGLGRARRSRER